STPGAPPAWLRPFRQRRQCGLPPSRPALRPSRSAAPGSQNANAAKFVPVESWQRFSLELLVVVVVGAVAPAGRKFRPRSGKTSLIAAISLKDQRPDCHQQFAGSSPHRREK